MGGISILVNREQTPQGTLNSTTYGDYHLKKGGDGLSWNWRNDSH